MEKEQGGGGRGGESEGDLTPPSVSVSLASPGLGGLKQQIFTSHGSRGGKANIRVLANSVLGKSSLPGL